MFSGWECVTKVMAAYRRVYDNVSRSWDDYTQNQCSSVQQLKKRKKSCFFWILKKTLKTLPTYSFTGHSEVVVCELIRLSPT